MYDSYFDIKGRKLWRVKVCVKDQNRKQHSKYKAGINSERKAKDLEFQFKMELKNQISNGTIWTWKTWHEECLRRMRFTHKEASIQNYNGRLKKWLPSGWVEKRLSDFTKEDVYSLVFESLNDPTPFVRRAVLKMVRRIFEMAVEEGIINRNPSSGIRVPSPKPRQLVLNTKEADFFLKEAMDTNHRFFKIWLLALKTGMRSGELYALRWQDIDFELKLISVNKQFNQKDGLGPPKNKENRVIPISDDLAPVLKQWKAHSDKCPVRLWEWADHGKTKTREVIIENHVLPHPREWKSGEQAKVTREFCQAIGITQIAFHDLRATFITNLLAQGVSLPKVMAIVGHRKTSTTDEYLRLAGVDISGATNDLGYDAPRPKKGAKVIQLVPAGG